jgi:FMNH2-dependent dimethyl sulfone monooxygenase
MTSHVSVRARLHPYNLIMNPVFGPNRFKLGTFSANRDGGLIMSLAPERWKADWDEIVAVTRIADDAGLGFFLPVAKWRGCRD